MTWEDNYLAHFGIKGQQWGVRRYQNEDGTLTEEGRQRYLTINPNSIAIYNKAADRINRDLEKINNDKRYKNVDLNKDDVKNLEYTKEVRDMWQNHYKDVLAEDLKTDKSSINGQKWLNDMFGYSSLDEEISDLEKKVKAKEKREKQEKINMNPKPLKDYSKQKMSENKAISVAYRDLEKIYPNFDDLPLETQDQLWINYMNASGLSKTF